ncbi:MAG: DMT family transporter [Paracoccaceae bacterium]|nr:DMT family transporter [Paracoccaceae bacterium]MDG1739597.1 DMT family transporter [Paracoccaceae bacterium]MDG2258151.1 DMT family transporter [Paracoccaceae bacterium]
MPAGFKGPGFALLGFLLFSTHDVIIKTLGAIYSPIQIVFFSTLLGFPLAAFLLMRDSTQGNLIPKYPGWVAARTVLAIIGATSVFYAFSSLPLSQVYAIIFASPLLITVFAIPILGEKVGIHRWLAVIVGLTGVLIVVRPGSTDLELGHIAAMVAAVASAAASVIIRRIGREERSVVIMLYPMMANVLVMGALLPLVYKPVPIEHLGGLATIAVLGFLGGLCIISAYRNAEAAVIAPNQYSQIVWSVIFGAFFFNEWPDSSTALGAGIVILSGLYILLRESRSKTSENTPVLRTRTRFETSTTPRLSPIIRAQRKKDGKPEQ